MKNDYKYIGRKVSESITRLNAKNKCNKNVKMKSEMTHWNGI